MIPLSSLEMSSFIVIVKAAASQLIIEFGLLARVLFSFRFLQHAHSPHHALGKTTYLLYQTTQIERGCVFRSTHRYFLLLEAVICKKNY